MKAQHTFSVVASVPDSLVALRGLTADVGWINQSEVRALFRRVDAHASNVLHLDPIAVLAQTTRSRLNELARDREFVADADSLLARLQARANAPRWFAAHQDSSLRSIAYFSPEFGLAASVPQYSGGLGILAGDHLKAAADLGVPLIGVGLFYRHGYFRQQLDRASRQVERFPRLSPTAMAMERIADLEINIDLAGTSVRAAIWRVRVDTVSLYLLDTELDGNDSLDQLVTDRLYGGESEQRIRQELLLGVGGLRAVRALGVEPSVFHLNEGHAGFLALELIRSKMHDDDLSFEAALEAVRPSLVFTTHTPVPAGIDRFPRSLIERYFQWWCNDTGRSIDDLMALGAEPGTSSLDVQQPDAMFNLAAMSLRLAGWAGGVSALHGEVSRSMFGSLWPEVPIEEIPITSVTNGVYGPTWVSDDLSAVFNDAVGGDWCEASEEQWRAIATLDTGVLWEVRNAARSRLVAFARNRLKTSVTRRRGAAQASTWCDGVLDPDALTIGFARRFATYKRATLLLRDLERFRTLVTNAQRPVQFVFAGKAHPADEPGKEYLRAIATLADDPELRNRVVFLEDYDIDAGRALTQGCDVWLNTPLRPMEACGTSGMKSAYNGGLNCSVLDGWWDEWFAPERGWAIPSADWIDDEVARDDAESEWLFDLFEGEIVPLFYNRSADGLPIAWLQRVAASLAGLGPRISAHRMVRDYVERAYVPSATRVAAMTNNNHARAIEFAAWRARIVSAWPDVAIRSVVSTDSDSEVGSEPDSESDSKTESARGIVATAVLGELRSGDVRVEVVYGRIGVDGDFNDVTVVAMKPRTDGDGASDGDGDVHFVASIPCDRSGDYGFSVRIVPKHRDLGYWLDLGLVTWEPSGP